MNPYLIAIDPGATGAFAFFVNGKLARIDPMPDTKWAVNRILLGNIPFEFVMEDVGDGQLGNSMQSVVSFAKRRATLDTCFIALGIVPRLFLYRPQEWQTIVPKREKPTPACGKFRAGKLEKSTTHAWVKQQCPGVKIIQDHADAVAIGLFHLNNTGGKFHDRQEERRERVLAN